MERAKKGESARIRVIGLLIRRNEMSMALVLPEPSFTDERNSKQQEEKDSRNMWQEIFVRKMLVMNLTLWSLMEDNKLFNISADLIIFQVILGEVMTSRRNQTDF